jgi:hypothetical protein
MSIIPTPSGGRVVEGSTPWGCFRVEWNAGGELMSHSLAIKTPCGRCGGGHAIEACPMPEGWSGEDWFKDSRGTGPCDCAQAGRG